MIQNRERGWLTYGKEAQTREEQKESIKTKAKVSQTREEK
jgi:hypothetical protein